MIIIFWLCSRMFVFRTIEMYMPCCLQIIFKWINTKKEKRMCVHVYVCTYNTKTEGRVDEPINY